MCWSIFPLFYCQFLSSLIGKKKILKWDKLWKYGGGVNSGAKGRRFEVRSVAWTSKQINIIFCQMGVTAACGSISPYNTAHDLCNWLLSAHATTVLTPHLSPHPWSAYRVLFECRSLLAEWFCFFFPRLLQWTSWSSDTCVVHPYYFIHHYARSHMTSFSVISDFAHEYALKVGVRNLHAPLSQHFVILLWTQQYRDTILRL